jgi:hypothetical protein
MILPDANLVQPSTDGAREATTKQKFAAVAMCSAGLSHGVFFLPNSAAALQSSGGRGLVGVSLGCHVPTDREQLSIQCE